MEVIPSKPSNPNSSLLLLPSDFSPIYHKYGSNIPYQSDFGHGEMSVPLHKI
jgi:hypothetical protein